MKMLVLTSVLPRNGSKNNMKIRADIIKTRSMSLDGIVWREYKRKERKGV